MSVVHWRNTEGSERQPSGPHVLPDRTSLCQPTVYAANLKMITNYTLG